MSDENEIDELLTYKKKQWHIDNLYTYIGRGFSILDSLTTLINPLLIEGFELQLAGGDMYERFEIKEGVFTYKQGYPPGKWETVFTLNITEDADIAYNLPFGVLYAIYDKLIKGKDTTP